MSVSPKNFGSASKYVPKPIEETNNALAQTDEVFRAACAAAGVEPTGRQYSKYKQGKGAVANKIKAAFLVKGDS